MEYFYRYIITPSEFQAWKVDVIQATGLARDALHIYFGLTIFLVARFIFGDRDWSGQLAWLFVFFFAVLGEVLDYTGEDGIVGLLSTEGHLHDIVNTLFWPTVLLLLGRLIFGTKVKGACLPDQAADQSGE